MYFSELIDVTQPIVLPIVALHHDESLNGKKMKSSEALKNVTILFLFFF